MSPGSRTLRAAATGAAIFAAGYYANNGGFKESGAATDYWSKFWGDAFDLSTPLDLSPARMPFLNGLVGACVGVGYTFAVAKKPRWPLMAGAAYGLGMWGTVEAVGHLAPRHPGGLTLRPALVAGSKFVVFGISLAEITDG